MPQRVFGGRGGCINGWSPTLGTSTGTWLTELATPLPEGLSVNDLPGGNEFTQSWTSFWLLSDPLSLSKISAIEWWLNNSRLSINLSYCNSAAATRCRWSSSNSWSAICSICIWSSFFLMEILCFCLARRMAASSRFSASSGFLVLPWEGLVYAG